jgi:hypothetical protein
MRDVGLLGNAEGAISINAFGDFSFEKDDTPSVYPAHTAGLVIATGFNNVVNTLALKKLNGMQEYIDLKTNDSSSSIMHKSLPIPITVMNGVQFANDSGNKNYTHCAVLLDPEGDTLLNNLYANELHSKVSKTDSDIRLKTNIQDYISKGNILDLPIKQFTFKSDNNQKIFIGCIAQDLEKIAPELVDKNKEGFLEIHESKLIYLLINEVKKLRQEVDELKK